MLKRGTESLVTCALKTFVAAVAPFKITLPFAVTAPVNVVVPVTAKLPPTLALPVTLKLANVLAPLTLRVPPSTPLPEMLKLALACWVVPFWMKLAEPPAAQVVVVQRVPPTSGNVKLRLAVKVALWIVAEKLLPAVTTTEPATVVVPVCNAPDALKVLWITVAPLTVKVLPRTVAPETLSTPLIVVLRSAVSP